MVARNPASTAKSSIQPPPSTRLNRLHHKGPRPVRSNAIFGSANSSRSPRPAGTGFAMLRTLARTGRPRQCPASCFRQAVPRQPPERRGPTTTCLAAASAARRRFGLSPDSTAALADGIMDQPLCTPSTVLSTWTISPWSRLGRSLRTSVIIAVGDEADVWLSGLPRRQGPDRAISARPFSRPPKKRRSRAGPVSSRTGNSLVARRIDGAVQLGTVRPHHTPDIMAGCQTIGAQLLREREQVVTSPPCCSARDGRPAAQIFVGKLVDHRKCESGFHGHRHDARNRAGRRPPAHREYPARRSGADALGLAPWS